MKLAFAVFEYVVFGGMQRNMIAIARECVARGHQLTIYTGLWQGEHTNEFDVKVLPVKGLANHRRNQSFADALHRQLAVEPADMVIGFSRMPGLDIYYAGDSCFAAKAYEDRSWLYRLTARCRMSLAFEESVFGRESKTHILQVSELEQAVFEKYYQTKSEHFHLLPPGISRRCIMSDDHQLQRAAIRSELDAGRSRVNCSGCKFGFSG